MTHNLTKVRKQFIATFLNRTKEFGFSKFKSSSAIKEYDDLYIILNLQKSSYGFLEYLNVAIFFKELMDGAIQDVFRGPESGHLNFRVSQLTENKYSEVYDLESGEFEEVAEMMSGDVNLVCSKLEHISSKDKIRMNLYENNIFGLPKTYWTEKLFN
jgi:hypothetical protein